MNLYENDYEFDLIFIFHKAGVREQDILELVLNLKDEPRVKNEIISAMVESV